MCSNVEEELKLIKREIVKINIYGSPGAILIGLGLYIIFTGNGDAFHPALNNENIVYSFMAVGVVIQIWEFSKLFPLWKKKAQINDEKNT